MLVACFAERVRMDILDCKELFANVRPEKWNDIPDLDLYMDQVIAYMKRQHIGFSVSENLTPAMVNNYVKQKVMPKANGKKYNREHIAYLTAICLLKQVVSVSEVKTLLESQMKENDIHDFYDKYISVLDEKFMDVDNLIDSRLSEDEVSELALKLAISSYAQKLACECLLEKLYDNEKTK